MADVDAVVGRVNPESVYFDFSDGIWN